MYVVICVWLVIFRLGENNFFVITHLLNHPMYNKIMSIHYKLTFLKCLFMFRICGFTTTYICSNHRLLPVLYWYIEENLVSIIGIHIDIKYQTILVSASANT
jgi:hypothetical protein